MAEDETVYRHPASETELAETHVAAGGAAWVHASGASLDSRGFEDRYLEESTLGEGGMGTVALYEDRRIGRHVAVKTLLGEHAADASLRARFLREARIQGQLEHPAIVPVYDLAVGPDGHACFTMKCVRGITFRDIIEGLSSGDEAITSKFSRRRLLTALSSVCLALDFAHQRGVVHRDLKPDNIMLGDYGEVYVLDWGLAKLREQDDAPPSTTDEPALDLPGDVKTMPGAVFGTPGYMPPEQARGAHQEIGPEADVYALGCILFELLTLQRLHEGRTPRTLLDSTLRGADARTSTRAPEMRVAPELEEVCVKATQRRPEHRFRGARDLQLAIERYLDGERDVERRRKLAGDHVEAARRYAGRATSDDGSAEDRTEAMRNVGHALSLDPGNEGAVGVMAELLTSPPKALPDDVEREVATSFIEHVKWTARIGGLTYVSLFAYFPMLWLMGVNDWSLVFPFFLGALVCATLSFVCVRRPSLRLVLIVLWLSNATFMLGTAFFGPFLVIPAAVAANSTAYAVQLPKRVLWMTWASGALAVTLPVVLQALGVLPPSQEFVQGGMLVLEQAFRFPETLSLIALSATSVMAVFTGALSAARVRDALTGAERNLYLYTWHLREMFPQTMRDATAPTAAVWSGPRLDADSQEPSVRG